MKVITIKQPWATLIALGYKKYEFRSWNTKYRGEILIHAGKSIDTKYLYILKELGIKKYEVGQIIAKAILTDCINITEKFEDRLIESNSLIYGANKGRTGYGFKLENVEILKKPIMINGQLGLWNYDL